jgi:hypothetical protein
VTSGVFAANPYRPTFNPYTQRPLHKNKRYLKQKKNKYKYQDKRYKFTYKQQQEREQDPVPKKLRRSVETEKQKGKRPASENENLTHQYSTPTKRSRTRPQAHSAEDHRKDSQNKKRTRTPTENQEPIQDIKLFSIITNKVITMMKIKGVRALDEITGSNKGKIRLLSRADEKKVQQRQAQRIKTQGRASRHHTRNGN